MKRQNRWEMWDFRWLVLEVLSAQRYHWIFTKFGRRHSLSPIMASSSSIAICRLSIVTPSYIMTRKGWLIITSSIRIPRGV